MTMPMTDLDTLPRLSRAEALAIAEVEDRRFVDLLRELADDEWRAPTDCDRWDVRAMVGHVAGAARQFASFPRVLRAQHAGARLAKRLGLGEAVDGANELQLRQVADLSVPELLDHLEHWAPRARRARFGLLAPLRAIPVSAMGMTISLGELYAYVLTRDVWMHRVDICRATGRPLVLTADHDGRLVADVVVEWARRHRQPVELHLTGPAGGHFASGSGGERIEIDAVEFCRTISGRVEGSGLLGEPAMF